MVLLEPLSTSVQETTLLKTVHWRQSKGTCKKLFTDRGYVKAKTLLEEHAAYKERYRQSTFTAYCLF